MSSFFAKQQQVAALDPRLGGLMASAGLYNLKSLIKVSRAASCQLRATSHIFSGHPRMQDARR